MEQIDFTTTLNRDCGYHKRNLLLPLIEFVAKPNENLHSQVLNLRSKVLNIHSKVLNVHSKLMNEDFIPYTHKKGRPHGQPFQDTE